MPETLAGKPLDGVLRTLFETTWGMARRWIDTGKVTVGGRTVLDREERVRAGDELAVVLTARRPRETDLPDEAWVHVDRHVVVINKPPGISTVPFDANEKGTLDEKVRAGLARRAPGPRPALGVVHRIDKETSGLVVFTRTWLAKEALSAQFRQHTVERRYLALVHGRVHKTTFRSHLVADRGDGLRGSLEAKGLRGARADGGQLAITHVEPLEVHEGMTLVACQLETGRTHQIRIHLSEAGHPLLGERVYIRGYRSPLLPAPRLMLHAALLGFTHPATEAPVRWEREPPADMTETLARLRA